MIGAFNIDPTSNADGSTLLLPSGYGARLCDGEDLTGFCATFTGPITGDGYCLTGTSPSLNDRVRSLELYEV